MRQSGITVRSHEILIPVYALCIQVIVGVDIFNELAQIVELAVVVQFIKVIIEIPVPAVYGVVFVCILLYNSLYAGKWLIFLRLNQPVCVLQNKISVSELAAEVHFSSQSADFRYGFSSESGVGVLSLQPLTDPAYYNIINSTENAATDKRIDRHFLELVCRSERIKRLR